MALRQEIRYKNSVLSFALYGTGPELLLAFHGYGKDASSLEVLAAHLGNRYKIVSIDIFYHGNSSWNEPSPPLKEEWRGLLQALLDALGNPAKFSVFGYSLGGRLAVLSTSLFIDRINTLLLMAATGIGNDALYNIAVNTYGGNLIFKSFTGKPGFVLHPFTLLQKAGLITQNLHGFITRKIDTAEKRWLLYRRWLVLKNFSVSTFLLKKDLNQHNTRVLLVYGKKDAVIRWQATQKFAKGLKNATVILSQAGHYIITAEILQQVKAALDKPLER